MKKSFIKLITVVLFTTICSFYANAQETRVTKTIKMLDFLDKSVIDAAQAQGGLHSVADEAARRGLKIHLRTQGMLVIQVDNGDIWRLTANVGTITATDDADWRKVGIMNVYNPLDTYTVGQVVLFNRIPEICVSAVLAPQPHDPNKWRAIGEIKRFAFANNTARDIAPSAPYLIGDIAIVTDFDNNAVNGNQAAIYLHDGTGWLVIKEDGAKSGNLYLAKATGKGFSSVACSNWVAVTTNLEVDGTVSSYRKASFSFISDGTNGHFGFAYPSDWTGSPVVYLGGNVLSNCFKIFEVSNAGRPYKVWIFDVNLPAATYSFVIE